MFHILSRLHSSCFREYEKDTYKPNAQVRQSIELHKFGLLTCGAFSALSFEKVSRGSSIFLLFLRGGHNCTVYHRAWSLYRPKV